MGHNKKSVKNSKYNTNENLSNIEGIDQRELELLQNALKRDENGVMNAMINHILNTFNSQGYNFKSIDEIVDYMQKNYNNQW